MLAALVAAALIPGSFSSAGEEKVVVSRPGTVFHRAGSGDVRGRGVEKPLDRALATGYTPCHVCYASQTSAGRVSGTAAGGAVAAATGRGNGGGRPTTGTTSAQPSGFQYGSLQRRYLDKEVKDPYGDLETLRGRRLEQGAYGDDVKGGHYSR